MNLENLQKSFQERLLQLRAQVQFVSQSPGVYLHKGEKNEILYVGKAKNLKLRLKSYFTGVDNQPIKTRSLVEKIYSFEVIVTENEYESLLLENNLIKHNMPKYNILLRDDKNYPFLKIDLKEAWPRVVLTRRKKQDGALYFGPYTIPGQVDQLLSLIHRHFSLVKCSPTVFKTVSRPCNYFDIKKCLAPCKLPVDKKEYEFNLNYVMKILNGKTKSIISELKEKMEALAKQEEFEKAAVLRNQIFALKNSHESQGISLDLPLDIDCIAVIKNQETILIYLLQVREGKIVGGQHFLLKNLLCDVFYEKQCLENFIFQYYDKVLLPKYIFFPGLTSIFNEDDLSNLNKFLLHKKENELKKNQELILFTKYSQIKKDLEKNKTLEKQLESLNLKALKNAENKLEEEWRIEEKSLAALHEVQNLLGLKTLPYFVEGFDISTLQGQETVGSQVTFKKGFPYKSGYRKYIIKDVVSRKDDFSSLKEVLRRRFKHRDVIPDILLVDGGTPQVREVGWLLKSLGLESIFLVGLAKARTDSDFTKTTVNRSKERLVIPMRGHQNDLQPDSPPMVKELEEGSLAYAFFVAIRNEAHRFAINFHRKRRDKIPSLSKR